MKQQYNEKNCPCKRSGCKRIKNCTECRKHHKSMKIPPFCEKLLSENVNIK